MDRALKIWLSELNIRSEDNDIRNSLKLPHTIYGYMLLLSQKAFQSKMWRNVLADSDPSALQQLYPLLAHHLKVTHIAITNPIPLTSANDNEGGNIIRSPSNFKPLYGDFGPATANSPPTQTDFDAAFWVTAKQNGIYQTWAPHWTMFSRGNISEKARILGMKSVAQAVLDEMGEGVGCAAVDLYAGIGYFAFSYLAAGVRTVVCWDLNAWSCEGLRRGAGANRWEAVALEEHGQVESLTESEARLIMFNESNERASERVTRMRKALPPIRHVNCGLLPTSRGSWQTAMEVLDPAMGGWVHVHENLAVKDIDTKAEEVRQAFQQMLTGRREGDVELEFVNRLKSYAPGVMHCVLDLYIPPRTPS